MTTFYEVGLRTTDDPEYSVVYQPSVLRFKNEKDASDYLAVVEKLQNRNLMPKSYQNKSLQSYLVSSSFYLNNELDLTALKKSYILSKLDTDERAILGI